jgi:hypothetical protein
LTLPEFIDALQNIGVVTNELRPKTEKEVVTEIAKMRLEELAEIAKRKHG